MHDEGLIGFHKFEATMTLVIDQLSFLIAAVSPVSEYYSFNIIEQLSNLNVLGWLSHVQSIPKYRLCQCTLVFEIDNCWNLSS